MKIRIVLVALLTGSLVSVAALNLPPVDAQRPRASRSPQKKNATSKGSPSATNPARVNVSDHHGILMVEIAPGEFMMGSDDLFVSFARPVHRMTISHGFLMSQYEVTQGQWQAVMGKSPSYYSGDLKGGNLPVTVSWYQAQEFADKLTRSNDGYTYRLPTEAEWEYACRAGTKGDYAGSLNRMGWYLNNSGPKYVDFRKLAERTIRRFGVGALDVLQALNGNKPRAVGRKRPNAFGLYDMHGNMAEWCQDTLHYDYKGAPIDGSAWKSGDAKAVHRALRGGSWSSYDDKLNSADREFELAEAYIGTIRLVAVLKAQ